VFREMEANGVKPDEVTYVGILSACSHAGLIDEGLEFFNSLTKEYSVKPVAEHYACMVDLLGRAGRLNEAFEFVQGMQIQPNAGVWGALLGACWLHKNHELEQFAAEKLFLLEPHKTSNYVLLSNVSAEAGKWDEAEKMRVPIQEKGVYKPPGLAGST
jgi:pentatricopeptide repeat protein